MTFPTASAVLYVYAYRCVSIRVSIMEIIHPCVYESTSVDIYYSPTAETASNVCTACMLTLHVPGKYCCVKCPCRYVCTVLPRLYSDSSRTKAKQLFLLWESLSCSLTGASGLLCIDNNRFKEKKISVLCLIHIMYDDIVNCILVWIISQIGKNVLEGNGQIFEITLKTVIVLISFFFFLLTYHKNHEMKISYALLQKNKNHSTSIQLHWEKVAPLACWYTVIRWGKPNCDFF